MHSKHQNTKFTIEREENNSFFFLDMKIYRDSGKLQTSVDRKPTFKSFLTILYNFNFFWTLLHRGFMICSLYRTLHFEILKLKLIFRSNGYHKKFFDRA